MVLDFHKESSTISGHFKKKSYTEQESSNASPKINRTSSSEQDSLQNFDRSSNSEQDLSNKSSNLDQETHEANDERTDDIELKSKHSSGDGTVKPLTSSKSRKSHFWKPKPFTHFSKLKTHTKK